MIYWINSYCLIICDKLIKWVIKLCNLSSTAPMCFLSYASRTPKNILCFKDRSIVDAFFLQRYNYDIMVTLTFHMTKLFCYCLLIRKKTLKIIMKILLMIIFVINCLPSTTFYQVYLFH